MLYFRSACLQFYLGWRSDECFCLSRQSWPDWRVEQKVGIRTWSVVHISEVKKTRTKYYSKYVKFQLCLRYFFVIASSTNWDIKILFSQKCIWLFDLWFVQYLASLNGSSSGINKRERPKRNPILYPKNNILSLCHSVIFYLLSIYNCTVQ